MKTIYLFLLLVITTISYSQLRVVKDNVYNPTVNNEARILYNDGSNAIDNKKYSVAIEKLTKAIEIDPNFTDAYDNLAICYRRIEKYEDAIKTYERSLAIFPKNRLALNNLGLIYININQYLKAVETYKKSIALSSNNLETDDAEIQMNGESYYGMSRAYYYNSEYNLAVEYGLKAYEKWKIKLPLYASDALYVVGISYFNSNNKQKGIEYFRKSNALGNANAKQVLKDLNIK